MRTSTVVVAASSAALLASSLLSYGMGALPGTMGVLGTVPPNVASQLTACGTCHVSFLPGHMGLDVDLSASQRSVDVGQMVSLTTSATGGIAHPANWGGFVAENDGGQFVAGSNSQISAAGDFITHLDRAMSNNRTWSYAWSASSPGPYRIWSVVNTVNGNGLALGDAWAFHGFDGTALFSTPIHVYANEAGVTNVGASCEGAFGNVPVIGSNDVPQSGNATFAVDLVGATENAPVGWLIGDPQLAPVPLDIIGVTGCVLHVSPYADGTGTTSGGIPMRGDGTASVTLPIPSGLPVGASFRVQAAIIDFANGRPTPVTMTNALDCTLQ